jgi:hypothetical protein
LVAQDDADGRLFRRWPTEIRVEEDAAVAEL